MKNHWLRRAAAVACLLAAAGVLAACAAPPPTPAESAPPQAAATVIDVRTPAEYAAGHLQGALNIDWQSDSFAAAAANLDPDGRYLLYCHSGRRAEQAQTYLRDQGFSQVDNLGGLDAAAAATGLPIVT